MFVGHVGTGLVGFGLVQGHGPEGELRASFIDPPWIGRGVGGGLLSHALGLARSRGVTRLLLEADPGAAPFYARYGARQIGEAPSGSIPGRSLPRMEFCLDKVRA